MVLFPVKSSLFLVTTVEVTTQYACVGHVTLTKADLSCSVACPHLQTVVHDQLIPVISALGYDIIFCFVLLVILQSQPNHFGYLLGLQFQTQMHARMFAWLSAPLHAMGQLALSAHTGLKLFLVV